MQNAKTASKEVSGHDDIETVNHFLTDRYSLLRMCYINNGYIQPLNLIMTTRQ